MTCCRLPRGPIVVAAVAVAALAWTGFAAAQAPPAPKEWRQVESDARTQDFRNKLREGTFDATSRAFLTEVALPQLALPANRDSIDRVRRRIRELLVADASLPTIVDYATALAKDETAAPVVRVNAMLLLGELAGKDRKPWPAAAPALVAAVGDAALPLAVRVAALAGLSDHLAASGPQLAPTAGPALLELAKADPTTADPVAVNWLAGRALTLLGRMGAEAPAETGAVATAVLADENRPLDVRVRAAAALGGSAAAGRSIDMAASLRGIRDLAITVVQEEKDRVRRMAPLANMAFSGGAYGDPAMSGFSDPSLSAGVPGMASPGFPSPGMSAPGMMSPGMAPGMAPGMSPGMPFGGSPGSGVDPYGSPMAGGAPMMGPSPINEGLQLAFRRAAWRLATLADALEAEGGGGLVAVAGPLAGPAGAMAKVLRTAATTIDSAPTDVSIEKASKALGGAEPPAPAAAGGGAAGAPAGAAGAQPVAPGAQPGEQPGAPAGAPGAQPGAPAATQPGAPAATAKPAAPQPAADGNPFAQ